MEESGHIIQVDIVFECDAQAEKRILEVVGAEANHCKKVRKSAVQVALALRALPRLLKLVASSGWRRMASS